MTSGSERPLLRPTPRELFDNDTATLGRVSRLLRAGQQVAQYLAECVLDVPLKEWAGKVGLPKGRKMIVSSRETQPVEVVLLQGGFTHGTSLLPIGLRFSIKFSVPFLDVTPFGKGCPPEPLRGSWGLWVSITPIGGKVKVLSGQMYNSQTRQSESVVRWEGDLPAIPLSDHDANDFIIGRAKAIIDAREFIVAEIKQHIQWFNKWAEANPEAQPRRRKRT